jgi:hypothetical protein
MLTVAGPVGFFLLWSMFWVGIYLAARALRLARTPDDRVAALAAICAQLLFLIQAFGDMGTQNWSTTWLVAAALTVAGRLAVSTGAWPAPATQPVFTLEPAWNFSRAPHRIVEPLELLQLDAGRCGDRRRMGARTCPTWWGR